MPYASVDDLAEYMGVKTFGKKEARAEVALDMASDEVKSRAPIPVDPLVLLDYKRRAKNGELLVAEYLMTTGGFRTSSSKGLAGLSKGEGYADMDRVRQIVQGAMGSYFKEPGSGGATSVATIASFGKKVR